MLSKGRMGFRMSTPHSIRSGIKVDDLAVAVQVEFDVRIALFDATDQVLKVGLDMRAEIVRRHKGAGRVAQIIAGGDNVGVLADLLQQAHGQTSR